MAARKKIRGTQKRIIPKSLKPKSTKTRKKVNAGTKPRRSRSTEQSISTTNSAGRSFVVPTIERRSGRKLTNREAVGRAIERSALRGNGFPSHQAADASSRSRSAQIERDFLTNSNKAPQVTGGRQQRASGREVNRFKPFNPGGAQPRGGGGATGGARVATNPATRKKRASRRKKKF